MIAIVVLAKLLLAAIFITAGLTKISDPAAARRTLTEFGVPEWLSAVCAVCLPIAEVAAGAGLISGQYSWYAAGAAVALLAIFVAGISAALLRGRRPECNCFGQLHSQPIG